MFHLLYHSELRCKRNHAHLRTIHQHPHPLPADKSVTATISDISFAAVCEQVRVHVRGAMHMFVFIFALVCKGAMNLCQQEMNYCVSLISFSKYILQRRVVFSVCLLFFFTVVAEESEPDEVPQPTDLLISLLYTSVLLLCIQPRLSPLLTPILHCQDFSLSLPYLT